jgi:uncharacterized protein (TIGR01777 family)
LAQSGHEVVRLIRREEQFDEETISWEPHRGALPPGSLDGADAVIHLAGENVAKGRWTRKLKSDIRTSRIDSTRLLCRAIHALERPPKVWLCASAIGFYGDRGEEVLTEQSSKGGGFLAGLCQEWERATRPAAEKGVRIVNLRFGVILSSTGGILAKLLPVFRLGLGGPIGNGSQYMSWIELGDAVAAIGHALATPSLSGPVNIVAPNPVTNRTFSATVGKVLSRPSFLRVPAFVARLALGEMADALVLASTRVKPTRLMESRFEFRYSDLEGALHHVTSRSAKNPLP